MWNFVVQKVPSRDYAGVVAADKTSRVDGLLVGCLRDADIENLDFYAGSQFVRRKVRVKYFEPQTPLSDTAISGTNEPWLSNWTAQWEDTETYVWKDRTTLGRESWDFEFFQRQKLRAFTQKLPSTWSLSTSPATRDVDGVPEASGRSCARSGGGVDSGNVVSGGAGSGTGGNQGDQDLSRGLEPRTSFGRALGSGGGPGSTTPDASVPSATTGQRGQGLRGGWWPRTNVRAIQGASSSPARDTSSSLPMASSDAGPGSLGGDAAGESNHRQCKACGKTARDDERLFRCARCRAVNYCSINCQRADWTDHKRICAGRET